MDWSELLKNFAEAISPALQVLIQTALVALAGQLSAWMYKSYQLKKNELSREQQYLLEIVVSAAVRAVEQVYTDGQDKREEAFGIAKKALEGYGVKLDPATIYAQIETQVFSQFGGGSPQD